MSLFQKFDFKIEQLNNNWFLHAECLHFEVKFLQTDSYIIFDSRLVGMDFNAEVGMDIDYLHLRPTRKNFAVKSQNDIIRVIVH